jgi:alpha-D-ribose 1-methylphosphonate 5-triphosphate diphosphatase PhnM
MVIWFAINDLPAASSDCCFVAQENCIEVFSSDLVPSVVLELETMLTNLQNQVQLKKNVPMMNP